MFGKKYIEDRKKSVLFLLFVNLAVSGIPTLLMFFQQKAIDGLTSELFSNIFVLYLSVGILAYFLLKVVYSRLLPDFSAELRKSLSDDVITSFVKRQAFSRKTEKITLPVIVNQYIEGVVKDYYNGLLNLSSNMMIALSSYLYAFFINEWIALVSVGFMIVNLLINRRVATVISEIQHENSVVNAAFLSQFNNLISNFQVLKTNNMKEKADEIFEKGNESFSRSQLRVKNRQSNYSVMNAIYYAVQKYSIIILAVMLFFGEVITAGELISCIFLAAFLSAPLIKLGEDLRQIASTKSYRTELERITQKSSVAFSDIEATDKGFCYHTAKIAYGDDAEQVIFEDISLKIQRGEKYLVLGKNGSGKSTLLSDLVFALMNSELSESVGVVFQNEGLLKCSVEENVTFFREHDTSKIVDLLKQFKLEKPLNTIVNDSMTNLSRGEIQRVLLARHLINDKTILILDEAVNGVEKRLQNDILTYLLGLDITLIMVSHKLERGIIAHFDKVLLVSDGKIQEQNTAMGGDALYERYMDE